MMVRAQYTFALIAMLGMILTSCVPSESSGGGKRTSKQGQTTTTPNTPNEPSFATGSTYWYTGESFNGFLTLNEDIQTVVYLRGSPVHSFLNTESLNQSYCLVASFNTAGAKQQMRVRAVSISFNNLQTKTVERLLRIDLPESGVSSQACPGTIPYDAFAINSSDVTTINSAFAPTEICPSCSGVLSSTTLALYRAGSGSIAVGNLIANTQLSLTGLGLRFDTKNNVTNPVNSCSLTSCKAKGFDCCLDGQCVKDGSLRPSASSESDFTQALADVASNPNHFINWPNIYFVCSTSPPPAAATPTPLPDAQATASAKLEKDIQDYLCLEEGKKSFPDFAGAQVCSPSFDQASFEAVREDVWIRCGCEATPLPNDPFNYYCPDFGLKAITNVAGSIVEVVCDVPPPIADPTPFQNLSLSVPARSAPHRFYKQDGTSVDDIKTLAISAPSTVPEGTPFSYADETSKTGPANVAFNMNAITGQFSVALNRALPAKTVNVEYDQTYIISTSSGYFTPCPQCAADSWFESFSARPSSQMGTGLQAVGHTTERDNYGNNTTLGNYEDTIFGRACWVPPTMLPFSHKGYATVQSQRMARLSTQTALYMNGYQRDWFGFNQGALIGSFDGVKWFAIGKGRRVTATGNKLFLAINAPFADLTDNSDFIVAITSDTGLSNAANFDYDPEYGLNDPRQNQGATCQSYHQCNVDSDCVSQLGWEYMCADTNDYRSKWPVFDINGNEKVAEEISSATFAQIIQGQLPGGSQKRCVYRGAGAPCKMNNTSADLNTRNKKKLLTCAPNFYCAALTSSDFNDSIVRAPDELAVILYGQDADVLGRPSTYVGARKSLPSAAIDNIRNSGSIFTSSTTDLGLCRPGKRLPSSSDANRLLAQHNEKDTRLRTDYINQISSCDSSAVSTDRAFTCPIFQTLDSQTVPVGDYIFDQDAFTDRNKQNMCGGESKYTNPSTLVTESTFKAIEGGILSTLSSLLSPSLALDACFRRPGAICHTDLDCAPNKLHADQAIFFGKNYFGGTDAEQKYWQESLVCGQAKEKPFLHSEKYGDYDLKENRCCRDVTKTITMYTQKTQGDADEFDADLFPYLNPVAKGRYSRYVVAAPEDEINLIPTSTVPYAQTPMVLSGTTYTNSVRSPKPFQWKTFHDTGKNTCCGGGWVRKFADGTNDWSNTSRLNFNPENFSCLNYPSEIYRYQDSAGFAQLNISTKLFQKDYDKICLAPADGGCIQNNLPDPDGFTVINPSNFSSQQAVLDTTPIEPPTPNTPCTRNVSLEVPYMPPAAIHANPIGASGQFPDFQCNNFIRDHLYRPATSFYLPIYVGGIENITNVTVTYRNADGSDAGSVSEGIPVVCPGSFGGTVGNPTDMTLAGINSCFEKYPDGLWVLHVLAHEDDDPDLVLPNNSWLYAGVRVTFNVPNRDDFLYRLATIDASFTNGNCTAEGGVVINTTPLIPNSAGCYITRPDKSGMRPGNDLYYLTKLARFELLGIPQIVYEPIYCNSDRSKMVEGLFKKNDRDAFNNDLPNTFPYLSRFWTSVFPIVRKKLSQIYDIENNHGPNPEDNPANHGDRVTTQAGVELGAVFSEDEFMCCQKLGTETSTAARCCSGSAKEENGQLICKLPRNANLNVYFNRFVSGEGEGTSEPGGGLVDTDFVPETGEPKLQQSTYDKLRALGEAYCANGSVRKGSAFGYFTAEPNNGFWQQVNTDPEASRYYSIIDSPLDYDPNSQTGTQEFLSGLRWDHHFYCN
jgi:hypothetical protein